MDVGKALKRAERMVPQLELCLGCALETWYAFLLEIWSDLWSEDWSAVGLELWKGLA